MHATFYCDESGNTGTDWGNPDQRIFVHGGWLVPDEHQGAILAGLDEVRRRHRLQAPELKWQQLARRKDPSIIFRDVFRLAIDNAAVPFFLVADKDYITAAKAVETYFDPAYNHHLQMSFTSDAKRKQQLAEVLLTATPTLAHFAELLRLGVEPGEAEIRGIASDLAAHLTAGGEEAAAATLGDFTDEEVRDIQREFNAAVWLRTTTGYTLWAVIQLLEGFLRAHEVAGVRIVHDNIVRFDELLGLIRSMFRASTVSDSLVVGGRPLYFNMPKMTSLELADSKSEPFIQLADLLCGFIRSLFMKLKLGSQAVFR